MKHLELVREDAKSFHLKDTRDNRTFRVVKNGLSKDTVLRITQRFYGGERVQPEPGFSNIVHSPGLVSLVNPAALPLATAADIALQPDAQAMRDAAIEKVVPTSPLATDPMGLNIGPRAVGFLEDRARDLEDAGVLTPGIIPRSGIPGRVGALPVEGAKALPGEEPAQGSAPPTTVPTVPPPQGVGGSGMSSGPRLPGVSYSDFGMDAAYKQAVAAEQAKADVAQKRAAEEAIALQDKMARDAQIGQVWDAKYQENEARVRGLQDEVAAGKIDAGRWWNDQSVGGGLGRKVMASFALLLGGLGGNQQQILGTIMRNIESDVDAQKSNLGKKQGLLSHYVQQGHSIQDAKRLAMADAASMYAAQLDKAKLKFAGQESQAIADSLKAELNAKAAASRQNTYVQGAQLQMQRYDRELEARKVAAAEAAARMKADEAKALPAETATKLGDLQALPQMLQDLDTAWSEKTGWASFLTKHIPGTPSKQYEDQAAATAQAIGTAMEGGKLSDFDKQFYRSLLPESDDSQGRKDNKISFLSRMQEQKAAAMQSSLGQSGYRVPLSNRQLAENFIKMHPGDPTSQKLSALLAKKEK